MRRSIRILNRLEIEFGNGVCNLADTGSLGMDGWKMARYAASCIVACGPVARPLTRFLQSAMRRPLKKLLPIIRDELRRDRERVPAFVVYVIHR